MARMRGGVVNSSVIPATVATTAKRTRERTRPAPMAGGHHGRIADVKEGWGRATDRDHRA